MKKLNYKKMLASALSCTIIATGCFQSTYAVTGSQVAADKSYQGHTILADQDDFDGYDIDVNFDVTGGHFNNISVTTTNMHRSNKSYKKIAEDKIKTLEGKSATLENINAIDATSGATYTINAIKSVMIEQLESADAAIPETPHNSNEPTPSVDENNGMIYGKVNLPFADFYYGELNNLTVPNSTMDLNVTDKAKSLKEAGMYDAVSSATSNKYKSFFPTTYSIDNENGKGGKILGVQNVDVAISKALYDEVQEAIREGRSSNNPLLEIVKNMTINPSGTPAPNEYKQINGDGTLTKTVEPATTVLENVEASISTTDRYGNYGIYINSDNLPSIENIDGVIITTDDGKQYAMKHLENIWRNPREISFAAKDGFIEPHGNKVNYLAYSDIQEKTIKEIRYLVKNNPDVVVKVDLFLKRLLEDNQKLSISNAVFENGVSVIATMIAPEGSNYVLNSLTKGRTKLINGTDYTVSGNKITILATPNTGIGGYNAKFTDSIFADMVTSFVLTSHHESESIKIENNKLILPDDIDKDEYYASISKVLIDGKAIRGRDITKLIFGNNLTADFNATSVRHGNKTPIFTKGNSAEYEIELVSVGYPSVKGKLIQGPVSSELIEKTLTEGDVSITAKMSSDAKLIVTKVDTNNAPAAIKDLVSNMDRKKIFDNYEISIQGKYEGVIKLTLPTSIISEKAIIAHLPTNGNLEQFVAPISEGKVIFEVNSLSPFSIIGDDIIDTNNNNEVSIETNSSDSSDSSNLDINKKSNKITKKNHAVKTNDTKNLMVILLAMFISSLSIYVLKLRKNK